MKEILCIIMALCSYPDFRPSIGN